MSKLLILDSLTFYATISLPIAFHPMKLLYVHRDYKLFNDMFSFYQYKKMLGAYEKQ